MLNAAIRHRWIIASMLSLTIVVALVIHNMSHHSSGPMPATESSITLASSSIPGVPPLSHPVFADDQADPSTELRADLFSGSAVNSILYFVFSVFAIFSMMRWREWRDRREDEEEEKGYGEK